jgi:hypothetical protein
MQTQGPIKCLKCQLLLLHQLKCSIKIDNLSCSNNNNFKTQINFKVWIKMIPTFISYRCQRGSSMSLGKTSMEIHSSLDFRISSKFKLILRVEKKFIKTFFSFKASIFNKLPRNHRFSLTALKNLGHKPSEQRINRKIKTIFNYFNEVLTSIS